uniref:Uncharacterized protein n=1 Tax=Oryza sativa subsp. japonica TaxID=39947 RepID=Q69SQ7_ORYSJ|nr:hypothetical protein [Oryza sativa Japonica Group]
MSREIVPEKEADDARISGRTKVAGREGSRTSPSAAPPPPLPSPDPGGVIVGVVVAVGVGVVVAGHGGIGEGGEPHLPSGRITADAVFGHTAASAPLPSLDQGSVIVGVGVVAAGRGGREEEGEPLHHRRTPSGRTAASAPRRRRLPSPPRSRRIFSDPQRVNHNQPANIREPLSKPLKESIFNLLGVVFPHPLRSPELFFPNSGASTPSPFPGSPPPKAVEAAAGEQRTTRLTRSRSGAAYGPLASKALEALPVPLFPEGVASFLGAEAATSSSAVGVGVGHVGGDHNKMLCGGKMARQGAGIRGNMQDEASAFDDVSQAQQGVAGRDMPAGAGVEHLLCMAAGFRDVPQEPWSLQAQAQAPQESAGNSQEGVAAVGVEADAGVQHMAGQDASVNDMPGAHRGLP